jgi:hypothetical protein
MKLGQKFQSNVFFTSFYRTVSNQYIATISVLAKSIYRFTSSDGKTTCRGILTVMPFDHSSGCWWPHPNNGLPKHCYRFEVPFRKNGWQLIPGQLSRRSPLGGFVRRAENWPAFNLKKPWIQFLFVLVAFLYGGLHCLAWNSVFPSYVKQLLWRISSVIIMAAGIPALACYFLLEKVAFRFPSDPSEIYLLDWRWRKYILLTVVMTLLLFAYVFGRVYLVVECFIQLFHLQPGPIFVQPSWSTYFPHLG